MPTVLACLSGGRGDPLGLAKVTPAATAFYRFALPLPILAVLAVGEQRRLANSQANRPAGERTE